MKKAILMGLEKIEVHQDKIPEPGPGEVRLQVRAAGICGTDVEIFKGNYPTGWEIIFPYQMGHELSGTIDAVGANVPKAFKVGDRVVPDGRIACGYCTFCRKGQINACANMGYTSGGFKEYSIYNYKALVHIPENVSFQDAAMAEPISCTLYGNEKLDIKTGDFGVVIGDGAIGLLHAQLLKSRGAEVAIVGLLENRLKAAGELGIDHVINAGKVDPVEEIKKLTNGYGANQVVVAVGVELALRQALLMAGRYGQVLYFAANMKESCNMPMDLIHYSELKVIGSYDSTTAYFEKALRAISTGAIKAGSLISHTYSLDEAETAFRLAKSGEGIKIMIMNKEK